MKNITENTKTEFSIMTDMLIVLIILCTVTIYYYGARAAMILAISLIACVASDVICQKIRHKEVDKKDLSAIVTGLVLGLMMSAAVPYYIVFSAGIFAIVFGKHAFGGRGHEIFNSAAVGFLFTALCFPDYVLSYPKPFNYLPLNSTLSSDTVLVQSMTKSILSTDSTSASIIDILIGKFSGPMGTGFIIILLISALFLIFRRSISAISFFTQLAIVFLFGFVYYNYNIVDTLHLISSGMLIFGIIFLSCDFSTIPKTHSSRFIYGILMGFIILLFHFYAKAENAVVYSVLIAAPLGIELDRKALSFARMLSKNPNGWFSKLKRRFNKDLDNVNETITLINGSDEDGKSDRIKIRSKNRE